MTPKDRQRFDKILDEVLAEVPEAITRLLDEVPMYVEDYPSDDVMRRMNVRHRWQLCGLYTGIPLTQRSVMQSGELSDVVQLYREGIMQQSIDRDGFLDEAELRRQIRITLLHELGHHHGLTEDDLEAMGYG